MNEEEIILFTEIMIDRLNVKNEEYGGKTWKIATPHHLINHLRKQVDKLEKCVMEKNKKISEKSADVANFAMMIADVCGGL